MNDKWWPETWAEMNLRHYKERQQVLQRLSDCGYTQTEAASILQTSLRFINAYAKRYNVDWKVKRQGGKPHAAPHRK